MPTAMDEIYIGKSHRSNVALTNESEWKQETTPQKERSLSHRRLSVQQERRSNEIVLPPVSFEVLPVFSRVFPWIRLE